MPKVTILPVELSAEIAPGESLLDAGGLAGVEMEAECFNCSCGTCAVAIVQGVENLAPATPEELAVLRATGLDPARHRLACTARVLHGEVTLRQLD
jgi:ferredoxin